MGKWCPGSIFGATMYLHYCIKVFQFCICETAENEILHWESSFCIIFHFDHFPLLYKWIFFSLSLREAIQFSLSTSHFLPFETMRTLCSINICLFWKWIVNKNHYPAIHIALLSISNEYKQWNSEFFPFFFSFFPRVSIISLKMPAIYTMNIYAATFFHANIPPFGLYFHAFFSTHAWAISNELWICTFYNRSYQQ